MNYIELINQFWKLRRSKKVTSTQADLYYCLLQECNLRDWENPFEFSNTTLCATIGLSEPTMIDARKKLKQLGLINFESGERKAKSPLYYLNNLSKNRAKPITKTEQKAKQKPSTTHNINIKQNKTKITPSIPQPGDEEDFNNLFPPEDGVKRNIEGIKRRIDALKATNQEKILILRKSNFGEINNPVWLLLDEVRDSNGKIKFPIKYILSKLIAKQ